MFDKNFFPSPEKVIDLLLENVNAIGCKRILEPGMRNNYTGLMYKIEFIEREIGVSE